VEWDLCAVYGTFTLIADVGALMIIIVSARYIVIIKCHCLGNDLIMLPEINSQ
jgi:hypothetical protein